MSKLLERLKRLTILYAEDDEQVKKDVGGYLELVFGKVVSASNGLEALTLQEDVRADVILTDIDMPRLNGIELAKKLRARGDATPIIIMTAHTKPEYLIDAVELDITRYLVKPFVGDDLLSALEKLFGAQNNQAELGSELVYHYDDKELSYRGETIPLTLKESTLLELFLSRKNHLFSTEELERRIWADEFVTDSSLRTLVKNLRKKLPVDCIKNSVGLGYKLVTGES